MPPIGKPVHPNEIKIAVVIGLIPCLVVAGKPSIELIQLKNICGILTIYDDFKYFISGSINISLNDFRNLDNTT